jgi:hypothetical protein
VQRRIRTGELILAPSGKIVKYEAIVTDTVATIMEQGYFNACARKLCTPEFWSDKAAIWDAWTEIDIISNTDEGVFKLELVVVGVKKGEAPEVKIAVRQIQKFSKYVPGEALVELDAVISDIADLRRTAVLIQEDIEKLQKAKK